MALTTMDNRRSLVLVSVTTTTTKSIATKLIDKTTKTTRNMVGGGTTLVKLGYGTTALLASSLFVMPTATNGLISPTSIFFGEIPKNQTTRESSPPLSWFGAKKSSSALITAATKDNEASINMDSISTTTISNNISNNNKTVMVTGANGFIGSYIVSLLLEKGYKVHACVRDASNSDRVGHLKHLPYASNNLHLFSMGDLGNMNNNSNNESDNRNNRFMEPMKGCYAVFHAATPINPQIISTAESNDEEMIYKPAIASTKELLSCMETMPNVKCLILTSSMSAVAPQPEPSIKDESHWSDSKKQIERGSWYGAAKTDQEKLVQEWVLKQQSKQKQKTSSNDDDSPPLKYVSICPTVVLGPNLNPNVEPSSGTTGRLLSWLKAERMVAPNDSLSFIHVEDCAKMHVAALESPTASGRYLCLVESWHWNDLLIKFKELCPSMPDFELYNGKDRVRPTQFDLSKMYSLGVEVRSLEELLKDTIDYLRQRGAILLVAPAEEKVLLVEDEE